ncbi:MAG: NAD(P)/FAD-dependent oxidoreductase [Acidimicrobiales bacterium]|nr:NAD(P)/FAD-dependent oxidoreductase [Acidimicrobiales bacterium]
MTRTTAIVVGAGHAGLAMSRQLSSRSIDHVVLERGEVANSWRTERWPSLRLLTPNWQTTLPSHAYDGDDPDGYMTAADVAEFIAKYAVAVDAPVHTGTTVQHVRALDGGYEVVTDRGVWRAPTVVLANGACNVATVPACAAELPPSIESLTPAAYRGPDALPDGGVLVVGASSTGVQLADEIARTGRAVTLSAGEQVRMPRRYRDRDIFWWMDAAGVLDEHYREADDIVRARHVPSPQLVGSLDHADLDLNVLQSHGVRVVGRIGRITDGVAAFAGSLANIVALADLKMNRLLNRFDEWAGDGKGDRPEPIRVGRDPVLSLDLARDGIRTVLWATGYKPDYSWLDVGVVGRNGYVQHDGGVVTDAPGMYVVGMPFLRRRRSTFISGAAGDTAELAEHLHAHLPGR